MGLFFVVSRVKIVYRRDITWVVVTSGRRQGRGPSLRERQGFLGFVVRRMVSGEYFVQRLHAVQMVGPVL